MIPNADTVLSRAVEINVGDPWFKVLRLPNDVFAIYEPCHQECVISFLIVGSQKSTLLDTGMGIRDISKVVERLTDLEVIVVNSHTHFDHVGDNHRFPHIFVYADEQAVNRLISGWSNLELQYEIGLDSFLGEYPQGFDPKSYQIRAVEREKINLLNENDIIDLGNRTLQVLHTPGHSPDCISLLDDVNKCLFTGDTFYPDRLLAFIDEEWGASDLQAYNKTMHELIRFVPELDYLYCSHTKALEDPEILYDAAKAFELVVNGEQTRHEFIELYGQELKIHYFNGFEIITKAE